jgi:PIN domain nuclease of toxin-antitoxin system
LRLLLDTHVLLWWAQGEPLSERAHEAITSPANEVAVSAVSFLETEIKLQTGKLKLDVDLHRGGLEHGFEDLPITSDHARAVGELPLLHRDPFDRVLIGQAIVEGMLLVTRDAIFERYRVPLLKA